MTPYVQGRHAAGVLLGITKMAIPLISSPSFWQRAGKLLGKWKPSWSGVTKMMIGEPGRFGNELVNRKALSKGSLIRQGFHTPGIFNKALFYGLPALDVVNTVRGDSPTKAQDIAGTLGGAAAGMAAFRPLGMVGAMAAGTAGAALGRGLVSKGQQFAGGSSVAQQPPAPKSTPYSPYQQMYPFTGATNYGSGN